MNYLYFTSLVLNEKHELKIVLYSLFTTVSQLREQLANECNNSSSCAASCANNASKTTLHVRMRV